MMPMITRGFPLRPHPVGLGLALLSLLIGPVLVEAADPMRAEVADLAREVAETLKSEGQEAVSMGQFRCPAQLSASAGPWIANTLTHELAQRAIRVTPEAKWGIRGEYDFVAHQEKGGPAARITGEVVDRSGKLVCEFTKDVSGNTTLASLFGLTVELPPKANEEVRERKLVQSVAQPQTHLARTRVSAGPESPYAIEVLVKAGDEYQPRAPRDVHGMAFVKIERDEIYAVKLINDSDDDAAVTLTIDGLNIFAFSNRASEHYPYIIVPKKSSGMVLGWYRTNEKSDAFQVTEYAKSAVAELLPHSGRIGTITATFAAAWPKQTRPPSDERLLALRGGPNATGRGPEVTAIYKVVERRIGVVRAAVSVRYTKDE